MLQWLILGSIVFFVVGAYHFLWHCGVIQNRFLHKNPRLSKILSSKLLSSLIIGLLIEAILIGFHSSRWLMDIEDASIDVVMQAKQGSIAKKKSIPKFVLLDIDDKTHQFWREPWFTPRDRLKNLIDAAVKGKAKIVVVDIDLSKKTPVEGATPTPGKLHVSDQELYKYLYDYSDQCKNSGEECPPIILAQKSRPLPESLKEMGNEFSFHARPEPVQEVYSSFLKDAVEKSKDYVKWASPLFLQSSNDKVLRRWSIWQPVCEDKQASVIPSIQLLVATLIDNMDGNGKLQLEQSQKRLDQLSDPKHNLVVKNCVSYVSHELSEPLFFGDTLRIGGDKQGIQSRIFYRLSWLPPPPLEKWSVRYSLFDETNTEVLTVFSAQDYAEVPPTASLLPLKDSIVVIGGSYSDEGDMYETPLGGDMPGELIVINAIYSLLQYGELRSLSGIWLWVITLVSIFLVSLLFSKLDSFWAVIFWGFASVVAFPFIVGYFSENGIWVSVALPLLAVQLHYIAADFHKKKHADNNVASKPHHNQLTDLDNIGEQNQQIVANFKDVSEQNRQVAFALREVVEQSKQIVCDLQDIKSQNQQVTADLQKVSEQNQQVLTNLKEVSKQQTKQQMDSGADMAQESQATVV